MSVLIGIPKALANPKSAILRSPWIEYNFTIFVNEKILRFQISVDDSSRMAEVNSVDQLEHKKFDLIAGDVRWVKLEIFFKVIIGELKDQVKLFVIRNVNDVHEAKVRLKGYLTIFGWGWSSFKMEISLMAVDGTPSSSFYNLIFFRATIFFVFKSLALKTTP